MEHLGYLFLLHILSSSWSFSSTCYSSGAARQRWEAELRTLEARSQSGRGRMLRMPESVTNAESPRLIVRARLSIVTYDELGIATILISLVVLGEG